MAKTSGAGAAPDEQAPEVGPPSGAPDAAIPAEIEAPAGALPVEAPEALAEAPSSGLLGATGAIAPAIPALRPLQRLHGITSSFWHDQLERNLAIGQAMLRCPSPQAALGLQIGYVQATVASGIEHAGEVARLSQDIARDMLPGG